MANIIKNPLHLGLWRSGTISWNPLQLAYDLAQVRRRENEIKVDRVMPATSR